MLLLKYLCKYSSSIKIISHLSRKCIIKIRKIYRFFLLRFMIVCSLKFLTMGFSSLSMHTESFPVISLRSFFASFALLWFLRLEMKVDHCETNSETIFQKIRAV